MKICNTCGDEKPLSDFNIEKCQPDGKARRCRVCTNIYKMQWVKKPENAEKKRRYAAENKSAKSVYDKERYQKNRAETIDRAKEYYRDHKEQVKAKVLQWNENNKDRRRAISNNYKIKRRSVEGDGVSHAEVLEWRARQVKICYWCGCDCADDFHIDHYYPLAAGGKHELDNLVIACPPCNQSKWAHDPIDFQQSKGLLI